jgi:hypothetical protein
MPLDITPRTLVTNELRDDDMAHDSPRRHRHGVPNSANCSGTEFLRITTVPPVLMEPRIGCRVPGGDASVNDFPERNIGEPQGQ